MNVASPVAVSELSTAIIDCPYPGLSYYEVNDSKWFFGRESERRTISGNLRAGRVTLLYAESGVGKSSLLRAGVAASLLTFARKRVERGESPRNIPVVFNAWKDEPVDALIRSITEAVKEFTPSDRPIPKTEGLSEAIRATRESIDTRLLIILDQFEEYFLYRKAERKAGQFAREFVECVKDPGLPANFLIAIREDSYAALGSLFGGQLPNIYENFLHLAYLERDEAAEAIEAPIHAYNQDHPSEPMDLEPGLVNAVLDQVPAHGESAGGAFEESGEKGRLISTPLLQLVMKAIWDNEVARGSHVLRLSTLNELPVEAIVDTHLGSALRILDKRQRRTATDVFEHLVTSSGAKIAEPIASLAERTGHKEETIATVLEKLDHSYIVRRVGAAPGRDTDRYQRYEIFHDVLGPAINRTIARSKIERRLRRTRWFLIAATVLVVGFAIFGFTLLAEYRDAQNSNHIAESEQLAELANEKLAADPQASTSYALSALRDSTTAQAQAALRIAFANTQELDTINASVLDKHLNAQNDVLSSVAFSRNGRLLATATTDDFIELWSAKNPHSPPQDLFTPSTGYTESVSISPQGNEIAAADADGTVSLFTLGPHAKWKGTTIDVNKDEAKGISVNDVAFNPIPGQGFAAVDNVGQLCLFTVTGKTRSCTSPMKTLSPQPYVPLGYNALVHVQFNRTGSLIATSACDAGAQVWTSENLTQVASVPSNSSCTESAVFDSSSNELATVDDGGAIDIWNLTGSSPQQVEALDSQGYTQAVNFSPNGSELVTGNDLGQTKVWDMAATRPYELIQLSCQCGVVYGATFNPENPSQIATVSEDNRIRLWTVQPRELLRTLSGENATDASITPLHAGTSKKATLVAIDNANDTVSLVNADTGEVCASVPGISASFDAAYPGIFLTVGTDGNVTEWSYTKCGSEPSAEPTEFGVGDGILKAQISHNGRWFVAVNESGIAYLGGIFTKTDITLPGSNSGDETNSPDSLAINASDSRVLIGYENNVVQMWRIRTYSSEKLVASEVHSLNGVPNSVTWDAEFSPDGTKVAVVDNFGNISVFNTSTNSLVWRMNAGTGQLNSVQFNPSGSLIVTAGEDGTIRLWSAKDGTDLGVLGPTPLGSPGSVEAAVFGPAQNEVLSTSSDGEVRVWSTEVTEPLAQLEHLAVERLDR